MPPRYKRPRKAQRHKKKSAQAVHARKQVVEHVRHGCFELTRSGSTITSQRVGTDDELREYLATRKLAIPGEVARIRAEVVEAFAPFDPLHIVAATWFVAQLLPDVGAELAAPVMEYVALLCAERPTPGTVAHPPHLQQRLCVVLVDALPKVRRLFELSTELRLIRPPRQTPPSPLEELEVSRFLRDAAVRMPSYWHQEAATIRELFDDPILIREIEGRLGFTPLAALNFIDHLADAVPEASADALSAIRETMGEWRRALVRKRQGKSFDSKYAEPLAALAGFPLEEAEVRGSLLVCSSGVFRAASSVTYEIDKCASAWGLAPDRLRAIVDVLAIETPQPPAKDPFFKLGHGLSHKPLLQGTADTFVCAAPGYLTSCLRPLLEATLKGGTSWNRYEDRRSAYLEERVIVLLKKTLRPDRFFTNVEYEFTDETGTLVNGEADGMLFLDSALVLVEAKAGGTDKKCVSIQGDTRALLGKAVEQAEKTRRAISAGGTFCVAGKQVLGPADFAGIKHIFSIAVTLEDMSWVAPEVSTAIAAGLIDTPIEIPWAVDIHDLELVCDLINFPAELLHYLKQRREIAAAGGMSILDELDVLMVYLERGLPFLLSQKAMGTHFLLPTWTHKHAAYVMDKAAGRQPGAARPRNKIPSWARRAVADLDLAREVGFLDRSFVVLDKAKTG